MSELDVVIVDELKEKNTKTIDSLSNQLTKLRTGRATPAMLDGIQVLYYGSSVPLNQVSTINVPEPRMIVINPFEKNLLADIEKAIHASNLGITPSSDGNIIRLPIPPLTEERRKEIAKSIRKLGEDSKVAVRQNRKHAMDRVKSSEKKKEVSEDLAKQIGDNVQKTTDQSIEQVDKIIAGKEKEVLTI